MVKGKIQNFSDLEAWKYGHKLVLQIYRLTSSFPVRETYSLSDQLRRASISVTSNIAEGFGRPTIKGKLQFYYMFRGSLLEVQNQLIIAQDLGYLSSVEYKKVLELTNKVKAILQGLINKSKTFNY
jgi:four helix bundle protein